jgi:protein disulfide-isomerase A1
VSADAELDEGVLVLTDDNFDEEIAKYDKLLIEFYAPWCGHCKKLAPEYSAAAEVLAKNDPPLAIAKVDATENKKVAERFGIRGFPTLFWFVNGEQQEYTGGRTKDTIVSWILKKSGPPSTKVTCDALKEKVAESKFLLAYFGPETEGLFTDAFIGFANTEDKIVFVNTEDSDCAAEYGAATPGVVLFRTFEDKVVPYVGTGDKDELVNWVKPLMVPTVFEFSEDEIEAVFGQQQPTVFLFRSESDKSAAFMTVFEESAKANKGKMLFAHSGVSDGIQARLSEFIGVTSDALPSLWALLPADMKKYKSEVAAADLTVESITKFVDDVKSGAISPYLKSAEPEANDGPLTVVVGTNFKELVMDETKDVLVKYYAPWCGHCKKLAPVWDELAEAYKDVPNLTIAKFDATANEAEGVEVQGFPTLIFYPRDNKAGVNYDGGRELPDFTAWLEENSGVLKDKATGHSTDEL